MTMCSGIETFISERTQLNVNLKRSTDPPTQHTTHGQEIMTDGIETDGDITSEAAHTLAF